MSRKRVIVCGSGQVGRHGLRRVLNHPELELVGQYVWSPEKVGMDSGIIAGREPVGVIATNDWQELYDLRADCMVYYGRFNTPGQEDAPVRDTVPFLERGTNVVTIATYELGHLLGLPDDMRRTFEKACSQGDSSVYFTGMDPGWATTDLALIAMHATDQVECVRAIELGYWGGYSAEDSCRNFWGFGQKPGFKPKILDQMHNVWESTARHLADAIGKEIDSWNIVHEVDLTDVDVETGFGIVEAGTVATIHFELQGLHKGKPVAIVEHVDSISRKTGKQWKQPYAPTDLSYRIEVEGDPAFSVEMAYDFDDGLKITAIPAVNAIPAVCEARSGILMPYDLPLMKPRR